MSKAHLVKDLTGKKSWKLTPEAVNSHCCDACYYANIETDCVCRCSGKFHGLGYAAPELEGGEKILPEEIAQKFREQYIDPACLCDLDLTTFPILYYTPHEGGFKIPGEKEKCWLYVRCPKCGYDMAVWKMGVKRGFQA